MNLEGHQLGEFTILERIGQSGMGAVYKASQTSLDRLVALKTVQASLAEDAEYIGRFRQEAKAAARLTHPNLVQVYSAGETEGLHWFAMEYVEGESAKDRLKRKGPARSARGHRHHPAHRLRAPARPKHPRKIRDARERVPPTPPKAPHLSTCSA